MATYKLFPYVPPGGWRYVQPDTAQRFESDTFEDLVRQVTTHRNYKGLDVTDVGRDIQRQLCLSLSTEHCTPEPGESYAPVRDLTSELTTSKAVSLSKAVVGALAKVATGESPLVDRETAEARAQVCRGCPFNKSAKLCSCSAVYLSIEAAVPKDRRPAGVSVCMACGCSLVAKVNLSQEVIEGSLPEGLTLPPWCWQRKPGTPL